MAMALLQPQQQQQQQRNWFSIDFEDDGGIYEVEVDMVGFVYSASQSRLLPGDEYVFL